MAVDMFLKLDGIKGEAKDAKYGGEIDIQSFSWGLTQTGSHAAGGGGGAGKVSVHDISVTKYVDKASCNLMLHCCNGKHIKSGMLIVRKAGEKPVEYLKIKLTDILISGYQVSGHGSEQLSENVTLNFSEFDVVYLEQDEKGVGKPGGEMGWKVKENVKK